MKAQKISDRIYALHADVKTEDLFEGIWPIPDGVSLDSYLIKGEKVALVDLVRDWGERPAALESGLSQAGLGLADVDYLVSTTSSPTIRDGSPTTSASIPRSRYSRRPRASSS